MAELLEELIWGDRSVEKLREEFIAEMNNYSEED